MDESHKGINEYFFSVGGEDTDSRSNMGSGHFTICGHETITNSIEGVHKFPIKKDGTPIKKISKAEILSFFKVEPDDCGVKTYKLVK